MKDIRKIQWIVALMVAIPAAPARGADIPEQAFANPFDRATIVQVIRKANDWQTAHPRMKADDRNWERGTWYAGVTAAHRATGDDKFLQQALDWGRLHQWQVGTEGSGANKLFCAMTWVELYLLTEDPAMLKPTLDWLATDAPNSPGGAKVWFGHAPAPFDGPLYSDSLFAMPVFALLHKATGDRKHLEYPRSFRARGDRRVVRQGGRALLPRWEFHRQEDAGRPENPLVAGQRLGLRRLAAHLECLPPGSPRREYQPADAHHGGGFGEVPGRGRLLASEPGRSGTCPGAGKQRHRLLLPRHGVGHSQRRARQNDLSAGGQKGVDCPAAGVSPTGMVQWGQQVGDRPSDTQRAESHEYVTGAFLLAASEVLRLIEAGLLKMAVKLTPAATRNCHHPPPRSAPCPRQPILFQDINTFLTRQETTLGFPRPASPARTICA